ncbi:hypothetical protein XU18_0271 [Perkinsela sp. CCAP 1560/4]|nr:hypothetical protein XU18_0271 [Perkinsela sp. CCAP 1560/4]|eukprot:KNH09586.1 hypothetical protein XU18_0271 [Perkinsela sp. CCAP 1560/4]
MATQLGCFFGIVTCADRDSKHPNTGQEASQRWQKIAIFHNIPEENKRMLSHCNSKRVGDDLTQIANSRRFPNHGTNKFRARETLRTATWLINSVAQSAPRLCHQSSLVEPL